MPGSQLCCRWLHLSADEEYIFAALPIAGAP